MKDRLMKTIAYTLLAVVTIGFTKYNTSLTATSINDSNKKTFDIPVQNVRVEENTNEKEVELKQTDEGIEYNVELNKPGDKYTIKVDVSNNGRLDAEINSIQLTSLTEQQEKYLEYTVTYEDGTEIKEHDIIKSGETKTVTITIKYKTDLTVEDLPTEDEQLVLDLDIDLQPIK